METGDYVYYYDTNGSTLPCVVKRATRHYLWLQWHDEEPIIKASRKRCILQSDWAKEHGY